ncbi:MULTISPECIES: hypothetical protein [unclassified Streptomyces]|uniref:hypothetical protein n=1 Tax=unclassified Streptomyces TaxID=2593676 RepID=UPI00081DC45B|nr:MULTISPECIES: hypothetical protein [unclassified Streptomyces]MYR93047.1 hypothetical protein [Streptomyces sp. SID4937]SCD45550.1 hypothetical protein GA0115243_102124 [Streptomyces sp. ScaeMP-e83]
MQDDWEDDSGYYQAVGCGWASVVGALGCLSVVIALAVAGALGLDALLELALFRAG